MPPKKKTEVAETTEKVDTTPQVEKKTQPIETTIVSTQKVEAKEKMGLVETISLIADRMEAVKKNGYNSFHKYHYAKASDIIAAVSKAKRGIPFVIIPVGFEETSKSEKGDILFGIMSFKLIATNGEVEITQVPCSGQDKGDKIPYKCMTGALKYLYTTLFSISDVDLDDVENEKEQTQSVAKKQSYTNNNYQQQQVPQQAAKPKVETINKTQIDELLELANKVPIENQDDKFIKTYSSIQKGNIPASKFENAKVYLQLQAKKTAETQPIK